MSEPDDTKPTITDAWFLQKSNNPIRGCIVALVAFFAVLVLPVSDSLTTEGHRLLALSIACLILWVTEALPIPVTSILAVAGQALVGAATIRQATNNFISPVFFFVLAMFLFAAVVRQTGLDNRFAHWLWPSLEPIREGGISLHGGYGNDVDGHVRRSRLRHLDGFGHGNLPTGKSSTRLLEFRQSPDDGNLHRRSHRRDWYPGW